MIWFSFALWLVDIYITYFVRKVANNLAADPIYDRQYFIIMEQLKIEWKKKSELEKGIFDTSTQSFFPFIIPTHWKWNAISI